MGSWLQGLWNFIAAIFSMMLDVAQFWKQVGSVSSLDRRRGATHPTASRPGKKHGLTDSIEPSFMVAIQIAPSPPVKHAGNGSKLRGMGGGRVPAGQAPEHGLVVRPGRRRKFVLVSN